MIWTLNAVSYACLGLITAVDKYDPDSYGPFASSASMWVLQNYLKGATKSATVDVLSFT